MEFETLKKSYLKRNIVIAVVVVAIISAIILTFTRAKYKNTESIPLVNGTINYSLADLNIVAIKVDGREVDTIPDGNYKLTSESYCTINNKKDSSIKLSYDNNTKALSVTPMTKKGTKCYLDFKTSATKKVDTILGQINVNLDTPDFNKTAQESCGSTSTCEETNGIYESIDDYGTTYYYRGSVDNNWVKFAGFYWRIIRINGDGSIRMIYQGTSANITGTETQLQTNVFSSNSNRSEYVGYMYTTGQQHGNSINSTIKGVLDSWYQTNITNKGYGNKVSTETGFCGDRNMTSGYSWSSQPSSTIYYAGYGRLAQNSSSVNPTFKCNNSNDLYTTSSSSKGNKALSNPIGLITADEVAMAGGVYGSSNDSYYLYTGQNYWTMSPYFFNASGGKSWARVFSVYSGGDLNFNFVNNTWSVRPVINLRSDVTISSGDGTSSNPYVIS